MKTIKIYLSLILLSTLFVTVSLADLSDDFCKQVNKSLGKNSVGVDVYSLQKKLVAENLLTDKQRVKYDQDTFNAIKKFQKNNKILQTGIVGPSTLKKMKSLWCQNISDNSTTSTNTSIEELPSSSVTFVGGRVVQLVNPKICTINGGSVDWGDGGFSPFGNLNRFSGTTGFVDECKQGFFHMYSENKNYEIKISDSSNNAKYSLKLAVTRSEQDNPSIESFYSTSFSNNSFLFKWESDHSTECRIYDNDKYSEVVKTNDSKIITTTAGKVFTLTCKDDNDRESTAYTVAGDEKNNPRFFIRQFNYMYNNGKFYAIWDSSVNADHCVIGGDPNTPLSGAGEINMSLVQSIQLMCFGKSEYESRVLTVNSGDAYRKPKINYFNYILNKDQVTFTWDANDAVYCRLSGPMLASVGNQFQPKNGKFTTYFDGNEQKYSLSCTNNNQSLSAEKTIILRK